MYLVHIRRLRIQACDSCFLSLQMLGIFHLSRIYQLYNELGISYGKATRRLAVVTPNSPDAVITICDPVVKYGDEGATRMGRPAWGTCIRKSFLLFLIAAQLTDSSADNMKPVLRNTALTSIAVIIVVTRLQWVVRPLNQWCLLAEGVRQWVSVDSDGVAHPRYLVRLSACHNLVSYWSRL